MHSSCFFSVFNVNRNMRISITIILFCFCVFHSFRTIYSLLLTCFCCCPFMYVLFFLLAISFHLCYREKKVSYLEISISVVISENPPYVMFANVFPAEDHVILCSRLHSLFSNGSFHPKKKRNTHKKRMSINNHYCSIQCLRKAILRKCFEFSLCMFIIL